MQPEEQMRKINKIIAKAWMDKGFKERLLSDPASSLKKEGVEIPPGLEVRIVEDTDKVHHMVLPPKPSGDELSEEQLANAAGGTIFRFCNCCPNLCP